VEHCWSSSNAAPTRVNSFRSSMANRGQQIHIAAFRTLADITRRLLW
jgi:hypothetical protein